MKKKIISQANRGKPLEELVLRTNEIYLQRKMAFIQQVPTPVKVAALEKGFIKHGWFEAKSTVDFIGVLNGRFVGFDCKSTREKSLPLKNIGEHQLESLGHMHEQGGLAFLLVEFAFNKERYRLTYEQAQKWWDDALKGQRKSIPYDFFQTECILVTQKDNIPLHYLENI